jgi:hypothetical protein
MGSAGALGWIQDCFSDLLGIHIVLGKLSKPLCNCLQASADLGNEG